MVERHQEEFVGGVEQVEQKPVHGGARIFDAAAEHTVADIEEHAQTDGDALARELGDGLRVAVLEYFEGLAREVGDQVALAVSDGGGDAGDFDAGLERTFGPEGRLRGQRRGRGDDAENRPARAHSPCYHQPPRDPLPEQDLS